MAQKAQFTVDAARRIAAATRRVEGQAISLYGQQQPTFRPGVATPHFATPVSTTGITVGLGRGLAGRAPERVYISYRGAVIEISKATAEALTGITASGYIVYEVVCTAGTWTATAAFSTTMTGITDTGKIYIPIANVTCAGSVITAVYQQLWDNPTVHIGSPQYSITVDAANGRLQFINDLAVPPPMSFYGTDQNGLLGWHQLCPLVDACAGGDPEEGQPCGDCDAQPDCWQIDSFAVDMFDPSTCSAAAPVSGSLWDGELVKTSSAIEPCLYSGNAYMEDPGDSTVYQITYMLFQYLDVATCTWRLQINRLSLSGSEILWYGDHTGTDPDDAAFTRVGGCDSTASITLVQCARTIRVTFSGITACCVGSATVKPAAATITALNAAFDVDEDSPGAGTWTFTILTATIDTYNSASCTGGIASSATDGLQLYVTYDGASTWYCQVANLTGYSVVWFSGTDAAGDATGGSMSSTLSGCSSGGFALYADSGSATIEVL